MESFLRRFRGRPDMLAFAEEHGIDVQASSGKPYSEDENLLHISHEAGVLEDPAHAATEDIYSRTVSPQAAPDVADPHRHHLQGRDPRRGWRTSATGP